MKVLTRVVAVMLILLVSTLTGRTQKVYLDIIQLDSMESLHPVTSPLEDTYADTAALFDQLRQSIAEFHNRGYLAASFDSISHSPDTIRAYLHAGNRYRWGRLNLSASDQKVLSYLPEPDVFGKNRTLKLGQLQAYQDRLLTILEKQGYPFATVRLINLDESRGDTLHATLFVEAGTKYIIDSVFVKGSQPVHPNYLYPYLGVFPGMTYDESKIKDIPEKIDRLSFIRQIRDFELEFSEGDQVDLYLYLERVESNQAEGAVGFLPGEGGGIRFTGQVEIDLQNVFTRGEQLKLYWSNPDKGTQELELGADIPYLFMKRAGIHTQFRLFKQDTSYFSRSARIGLPFYVEGNDRIEVFADLEASTVISDSPSLNERFGDFRSSRYGVRYLSDHLDYRLNPSKGWMLDVFLSAGKKKLKDAEKPMTSASAGLDASGFIPLYGNWVIQLANVARFQQSWDGQNVVPLKENELYRFGGFGSLRGFDDNALRASIYTLSTIQLKYMLSRNSNAYAFFDGAWYEKNVAGGQVNDFPFGFGLGAHIDSGAGIFYISYALGRQLGNPIEVGSARIHLGYVSKF